MPDIRIGVSGWQYPPWRGDFYPKGLPHRRELEYASRTFNSIEVNGTFYSLKSPAIFAKWREDTPDDFVFAVKGSRYITHMLRLRKVRSALGNFFANGVLKLGAKLGPILWQLPPKMSFEPETFSAFCEMLPRTFADAARIARRHDSRVQGKMSLSIAREVRSLRIRHAFEIRDPRMMNPELIRILRRHRHALCLADTAGRHPYAEDITAGFVYVRLHGAEQLYTSGYTASELAWWGERIRHWSAGREAADACRISPTGAPKARSRDVFVFFDNDAKGHAPFDALRLATLLGAATRPAGILGLDEEQLPPPPRLASLQGHRRDLHGKKANRVRGSSRRR